MNRLLGTPVYIANGQGSGGVYLDSPLLCDRNRLGGFVNDAHIMTGWVVFLRLCRSCQGACCHNGRSGGGCRQIVSAVDFLSCLLFHFRFLSCDPCLGECYRGWV